MSRGRLFRITLLVVALSLPTLPSFAAGRYFSLSTGAWLPHTTSDSVSNQSVSYSPGWSLGGTLGTAFDNGLRIENELTYRQAEAKGGRGDQWNLGWMVNAWWEAKTSSPVAPYFGGGVGFGRGRNASPGFVENSGSGVAYQAGGGLIFSPGAFDFDLDFGYRYFGINDSRDPGIDLEGSSWTVGLRKMF